MSFLKRYKNRIIAVLVTVIVLVIAFMASGEKTPVTENEPTPSPCVTATMPEVSPTSEVVQETATHKPTEKPTTQPQEQVTTIPTTQPQEQETEETDSRLTCTLSVKCHTILNNMSKLKPEKTGLVPSNGVIFPETEVEFYEGESVINILTREMKKSKIHLEFVNVPLYNSAYIEGIANLYEHDCGELSGWMYRVNGIFPNYGPSQYTLRKGDRVEWLYTCDMGTDIGGGYASRNGRKNDN